MEIIEIIKDIIVPITSAIIGGLLTFLGVVFTIKRQKITETKERINKIRPWIFTKERPAGPCQSISLETADYDPSSDRSVLSITIWNSDNGIAIIDKVTSRECIYKPNGFNIIDKNSIAIIELRLKNRKESFKDFQLKIKDIDGNPYIYNLEYKGSYLMIKNTEQ